MSGQKSAGQSPPANKAVVYTEDFKLQAITLYEATGSLERVSKQLGISKSTLSRWVNGQNVPDEIVVAAKEISADVRKDVGERMGDLLSKVVDEVERRFDGGAYSSYELVVMAGIFADKFVNLKKMSQLDEAKNVEVHWPTITPLTPEEIEAERVRVKAEFEEKQNQIEE